MLKSLILASLLFINWTVPAFGQKSDSEVVRALQPDCRDYFDNFLMYCKDNYLDFGDVIRGSANCITGEPYISDKIFKCFFSRDVPDRELTLKERQEIIKKHNGKFRSELNECEEPTPSSERKFVSYNLMRSMTSENLNCFLISGIVGGEIIPSWIIAISDVSTKVFLVEQYVERDIPIFFGRTARTFSRVTRNAPLKARQN